MRHAADEVGFGRARGGRAEAKAGPLQIHYVSAPEAAQLRSTRSHGAQRAFGGRAL